ncbi:MAG: hypothetical protein HY912_15425 [Desulfomonile tiedjei]|uniref:Uncharacterized protein n=1 Tax=Desulfomonile tiedjei TaxID=2358 RepID=A0A9D6V3L7_9BACT|nr:hypothetical protein [Desulfomonile tiedjei]
MFNDSEGERLQASKSTDPRAVGLDEGFLIMLGHLIETALSLSACLSSADAGQMSRCETLAMEVRELERSLTRRLLASREEGDRFKALIRLPFLLLRIEEKLDYILNCCRLKCKEGISFNGKAEAHLQQLIAILVDMMNNLRDAFSVSDALLVKSIISEGCELSRIIRDFRSAYWCRPRIGPLALQATAIYLDILDAVKSANEDVGNICTTLLEIGTIPAASAKVSERIDTGKFQ